MARWVKQSEGKRRVSDKERGMCGWTRGEQGKRRDKLEGKRRGEECETVNEK